jgi:hypothetical protein
MNERFGFICSGEEITAVQRVPDDREQGIINDYRAAYRVAMQLEPHGLHYIPALGGVWLPPVEETGVEGEVERVALPDEAVRVVG